MRYLSVCSGIEAATVAWHPLGWTPAAFSEIEAFPRSVLAHHYPDVPCHGDFTTIGADDYGAIDLLVGGTPCQDFSIGGLRTGLAGTRGNLSLEYMRLLDRKRPCWMVWENVPGVLSNDGGRAFGAILGALAELGYGWSYRVLDAQYFGVPQQRPRVIVVGCAGSSRAAASVLFERASFAGRPAKGPPAPVSVCITRRGPGSLDDRETYIVEADHPRHMTPREIERCFGFPDDYTLVPHRGKPAADGPRYKALGNSMAVPVMRWLGERIAMVKALSRSIAA
jgi:DNA (cytosine-5)-methyltransferase 1